MYLTAKRRQTESDKQREMHLETETGKFIPWSSSFSFLISPCRRTVAVVIVGLSLSLYLACANPSAEGKLSFARDYASFVSPDRHTISTPNNYYRYSTLDMIAL